MWFHEGLNYAPLHVHLCMHNTGMPFEVNCTAAFVENNQVLEITCVAAPAGQTIRTVQYNLNGGDRLSGIESYTTNTLSQLNS